MRSNLFWLSDEQWCSIQPLLPMDVRGKARVDDRRVISGIVFVIKSGCRWCDCPPEWPSEDDLQSVCSLGGTRSVGAIVPRTCKARPRHGGCR